MSQETEEKRLHKLGPSFERARKRWLTSVGDEGLDTLEAVRKGGVGPNGGARYHLWYRTPAHAAAAAERLDGAQMSGAQGHGQRASATLDFSVSIFIRGSEHAVIRKELHAIVSADTEVRAMVSIRPIGRRREPRDVCVTITGENAAGMAKAYQLVQKLQNGVLLPVAPSDRNKVMRT